MIASRMGVAPEAVSKWFKGISMPRPAKMAELANLLEVDPAWLGMGIKAELDRVERSQVAKNASAAAMYLRSIMALAGVHCADPNPNDPQFERIDFYATLNGVAHPIRVTLGRAVGDDQYDLSIPSDFKHLRHFGLVQWSTGNIDVIDMPASKINLDKTAKNGDFLVRITRVGDLGYTSDRDEWLTIRDFRSFA